MVYNKKMKVLAFETSCDETSCAIVQDGKVLANVTTTHILHRDYGGVIPEIASRAHTALILPSLKTAIEISKINVEDVDLISATQGPGLIGALLVGFTFAKSLAYFYKKPFVGVDHLEAHLYSIFLDFPDLKPPILFLLASGGHTEFFLMEENEEIKYIGGTLDDAAGEAFDKGAKILGFPYPGGSKLAEEGSKGDPFRFNFPRAKTPPFTFSFSGLKTSLLYFVKKRPKKFINENLPDICASYQEAIVDMLLEKTVEAASILKIKRIAVVGGVSANERLREKFKEKFDEVYFPSKIYTTDNACMVALRAISLFKRGITTSLYSSCYTVYPLKGEFENELKNLLKKPYNKLS
jgi:N6-L-threonylcarbamoyladenine synthase